MFTLSRDELAPIVAALEVEDAEVRPRLGRNQGQWDRAIAILRDQLARTGSESSRSVQLVRIRSGHERRAVRRRELMERRTSLHNQLADALAARLHAVRVRTAEGLLEGAIDDLRAWAGRDPIELAVDADAVTAVLAPGWAAALRVDGWMGLDIDAIGGATAWLGEVDYELPRDLSGTDRLVVVNDSVVRRTDGTLRFRTLYAPVLGWMAIASPDPMPALGGAPLTPA
ncbi:MAG: hypothetical protein JNK12_19425 [Acidimicrobiales bacterium]|nr:hypothetical protein [Acidimicrobiales bacterium]